MQFGVVLSNPRTTRRQRNRANPQVADSKGYCCLLRCRLKKNAYQYLAQLLIPTNLNKLKWEDELHIYDAYREDLQTQQGKKIKSKVVILPHRPGKTKPSLWDIGTCKENIVHPHLYCILKIYITMPPSTATTEISFSVLKRVKTYLPATMGQERLSSLALLNIHRDIQLTLNAVVDKFSTRQRNCFWLDCV